MPTRIRLRRTGRKGQGYFRIVVADQEMARDGRVVATLGHYDPRAKPAVINVDADKARAWLSQGARPTDTVRSLLRQAGVLKGGAGGPAAPAASPAPPPE
ncbi:MAG: 30S ribosomal protein S16 [Gemmatimonadetes bacterium]|nr:30S ribosomal protein S16 [Gemmatimonadota bacterium]MBI2404188.1 30S ribosomal protein S16 [Gemmatimonadota bacterium]